MSPIVRLITAKEPEQVFIPIEDIPLVLSDLRRSLPQLRDDLRLRWPVESVRLEERRPRRKNPFDPLQVVEAACIGLVVVFSSAMLKAAGTKVGDAIGDGVKPFVTRWINKRFTKSDKRGAVSRKKNRRKVSRPS
jgi:hypothetical protein